MQNAPPHTPPRRAPTAGPAIQVFYSPNDALGPLRCAPRRRPKRRKNRRAATDTRIWGRCPCDVSRIDTRPRHTHPNPQRAPPQARTDVRDASTPPPTPWVAPGTAVDGAATGERGAAVCSNCVAAIGRLQRCATPPPRRRDAPAAPPLPRSARTPASGGAEAETETGAGDGAGLGAPRLGRARHTRTPAFPFVASSPATRRLVSIGGAPAGGDRGPSAWWHLWRQAAPLPVFGLPLDLDLRQPERVLAAQGTRASARVDIQTTLRSGAGRSGAGVCGRHGAQGLAAAKPPCAYGGRVSAQARHAGGVLSSRSSAVACDGAGGGRHRCATLSLAVDALVCGCLRDAGRATAARCNVGDAEHRFGRRRVGGREEDQEGAGRGLLPSPQLSSSSKYPLRSAHLQRGSAPSDHIWRGAPQHTPRGRMSSIIVMMSASPRGHPRSRQEAAWTALPNLLPSVTSSVAVQQGPSRVVYHASCALRRRRRRQDEDPAHREAGGRGMSAVGGCAP